MPFTGKNTPREKPTDREIIGSDGKLSLTAFAVECRHGVY